MQCGVARAVFDFSCHIRSEYVDASVCPCMCVRGQIYVQGHVSFATGDWSYAAISLTKCKDQILFETTYD